ncbi:MAG: 2Fe-2S iron-sulfur cluster-binding protein [Candidatus Eisenbacteria bacterium]
MEVLSSSLRKSSRIEAHPIIRVPERREISFTFNGAPLRALEGEVISSALFAHGVHEFGHHPRDGSPQGIFCVNGQCSQCLVIANGMPVKACMTAVRENMDVRSCEGLPSLPELDEPLAFDEIPEVATDVLVIGGGPAGISAAIELGRLGARTLLIDDKASPGGKLTLQTHFFFGSRSDCFAGTRGIQIAELLSRELAALPSVEVWTDAMAVGVFLDKKVGVVRKGRYVLVSPRVLLVACGAREKTLAFQGCDLPGVYGAGAFQTLVNRDLVRPARRLFVGGGGNVGLIGSYHALQAGIHVAGLCEALPKCTGYKVHEDKIRRLGVPIFTSHTVVRALGNGHVEGVTIASCDERFRAVSGTERTFEVDTVLIAVGLSAVNELFLQAKECGMEAYAAGDSEEIAEASAAIFSGRVTGRKIARSLGVACDLPPEWADLAGLLRSKPGRTLDLKPARPRLAKFPIVRCTQEIPCDPCTKVCPKKSISIPSDSIMGLPEFSGECLACARCVVGCPGLAIVLVELDYDPEGKLALVTVPFEFSEQKAPKGARIVTTDGDGEAVGTGTVVAVKNNPRQHSCRLLMLEVPYAEALSVAGVRLGGGTERLSEERGRAEREGVSDSPGSADGTHASVGAEAVGSAGSEPTGEEIVICRCERVSKDEIVAQIRSGVRDMNQLKAVLRTGMGACGGKTCRDLILGLFREEGVELPGVTLPSQRPFEAEVSLAALSGCRAGEREDV